MAATSTPVFSLLLFVAAVSAVAAMHGDGALMQTRRQAPKASAPAAARYTTNAICTQNNCVHPVFPALLDLGRLEQQQWQCSTRTAVGEYLDFCKSVVNYDVALPLSPNNTQGASVQSLVQAQDDAAASMYFYHLSALGVEAWDHTKPEMDNDVCVSAVHRLVCFTYFPRNEAGCKVGEATPFKRPCSSSCANYVRSCQVECCDESVSCVFQPPSSGGAASSSSLAQKYALSGGYTDASGPSALCTGAARRGAGPSALLALLLAVFLSCQVASQVRLFDGPGSTISGAFPRRKRVFFLAASLVAIALSLQGCLTSIPLHSIGNWQQKPDYLVAYEYVPPGKNGSAATLNSCAPTTDTSRSLQCNGHGYCKSFLIAPSQPTPITFCHCDSGYADPECRTRRKSQVTAFLLSLFGGFLGLDLLYLGFPGTALLKLCTCGGFGFWWIVDIVRTGSDPVYASQYRVAHNLSHWAFVLGTFTSFVLLGFAIAGYTILNDRRSKRCHAMALHQAEENNCADYQRKSEQMKLRDVSRSYTAPMGFSGYGATLPTNLPNAAAPYATPPPPGNMGPPFAGPYGPASGPSPSYPVAGLGAVAGSIPLTPMTMGGMSMRMPPSAGPLIDPPLRSAFGPPMLVSSPPQVR